MVYEESETKRDDIELRFAAPGQFKGSRKKSPVGFALRGELENRSICRTEVETELAEWT